MYVGTSTSLPICAFFYSSLESTNQVRLKGDSLIALTRTDKIERLSTKLFRSVENVNGFVMILSKNHRLEFNINSLLGYLKVRYIGEVFLERLLSGLHIIEFRNKTVRLFL